jgi:hypothetical protein
VISISNPAEEFNRIEPELRKNQTVADSVQNFGVRTSKFISGLAGNFLKFQLY